MVYYCNSGGCLVEFGEAKGTLCFILFISLQGLFCLPLDCSCHGHHPQKSLRTEKLGRTLNIISIQNKGTFVDVLNYVKGEKKALANALNLVTRIRKPGHIYKSVITRSHVHT